MERINIIDCPLGEVGKHLGGYGNIFIIHDRNVGGIVERLGVQAQGIFPIEATEERKTLATVLEIEEWLLEKGADREAFGMNVTLDDIAVEGIDKISLEDILCWVWICCMLMA